MQKRIQENMTKANAGEELKNLYKMQIENGRLTELQQLCEEMAMETQREAHALEEEIDHAIKALEQAKQYLMDGNPGRINSCGTLQSAVESIAYKAGVLATNERRRNDITAVCLKR